MKSVFYFYNSKRLIVECVYHGNNHLINSFVSKHEDKKLQIMLKDKILNFYSKFLMTVAIMILGTVMIMILGVSVVILDKEGPTNFMLYLLELSIKHIKEEIITMKKTLKTIVIKVLKKIIKVLKTILFVKTKKPQQYQV
jgi:hypothetical protein